MKGAMLGLLFEFGYVFIAVIIVPSGVLGLQLFNDNYLEAHFVLDHARRKLSVCLRHV
jgi:uncharacterized membrane protein